MAEISSRHRLQQFYLTVLIGGNIACVTVATGGLDTNTLLSLLALAALLSLHYHMTSCADFLSEFTDLNDRPTPQPVMMFGNWIEKIKYQQFSFARGPWQKAEVRLIAGGIIWSAFSAILHKHFELSFAYVLTGAFATWAFASTRLYKWTSVAAFCVFVTAVATKSHLVTVIAVALLLALLALRRMILVSYSEKQAPPLQSQVARTVLLFVAVYTTMAFVFPDQKLAKSIDAAKAGLARKVAEKITEQTASALPKNQKLDIEKLKEFAKNIPPEEREKLLQMMREMKNSNQEIQLPNVAGDAAKPPEGPPLTQEEFKKQLEQLEQMQKNALVESGGSFDGQGQGDQAGARSGTGRGALSAQSSSGAPQSESAPSIDKKIKKEEVRKKLEFRLEKFEGLLRLTLIIAALTFLYHLFNRKPVASDKDRDTLKKHRRRKRRLKTLLKDFQSQAFASKKDEVVAGYHLYLLALSAEGIVKLPRQTPTQFLSETEQMGNPYGNVGKPLTSFFNAVYYGETELSAQEFATFRKAVKKLKEPFRLPLSS